MTLLRSPVIDTPSRNLPCRSARLSRRAALLGTVSWGGAACLSSACETPGAARGTPRNSPGSAGTTAATPLPSNSVATPNAAQSASPSLDVVRLGPLREDERGGLLVVLLHGWRANGDDLVPLAAELAQPGMRFLVPAAPLAEPNGGRAWWRIDGSSRPTRALRDEVPEGFQPHPQLLAARQAVQALLRDAQQRYAPSAIALAGFSQGAMLALDVALAADPPVARVAALSGTLLVESLPALRAKKSAPVVLVTHGRSDPMLPFEAGAAISTVLMAHGYPVTFSPFEGGHQIPREVVSELRAFLAASTR